MNIRKSVLRLSAGLDAASADLDRLCLIEDDPEALGLAVAAIFRSLSAMIVEETKRVRASR
jgi:hypothetical protein